MSGSQGLPDRITTKMRSMSSMAAPRTAALAILVLVLAACGSRLDPETVANAGGGAGNQPGVAGSAGGEAVPGADGAAAGGTGADPGAGPAGEGGAGSGATGGSAGGAPAVGTGKGSATGGVKAASCAGFKNQKGITAKEITIANASDISGPVPGLFESSQLAVRAYVNYFNSQSNVCGRKLKLLNLDTRTDAGADQQAYVTACEQAFAAVGSMGGFDSGGAKTAEGCGLPDIRATMVSPERQACRTCFGVYALKTNLVAESGPKWLMSKYPEATKNVGVLYINAGGAPVNAKSQAAAWKKIGWDIKLIQGIDVSEFNFAPYVQQLKDKGVKMVVFTGPYQNVVKLQQAMRQQGYKPDVFMQDPSLYDANYTKQAGDLAEGVVVYSTTDMFENKGNAEMQLYLSWLQQVKPGATPNFFGLYSWSAARLFVERAISLGGKLSRSALVGDLNRVSKWTANGLHTAQNVATGDTPPCQMIIQYKGGQWRKISPGTYLCGGMVNSGVGG